MAYTALYRKLRPDTFDGVVGQSHIIRSLTNQMQSGRISHAYLFCGTRGTGKTTTAKVFAKAINCEQPANGEPCGACEACHTIDSGVSMNVIEIDAASNNGVDNIRDIREEVKYPPATGRYKVYIIDEVHMLSAGAFNALLKTLEEPPSHVVFILATTDPQKIPATILSRCQRFDFRRISSADMAETLKRYMQDENVRVEDEALEYVARISDGAMRDALSLLDQCISYYYDEEITLAKVLDITGSVDNAVFFAMTDALLAQDAKACMEMIDDAAMRGRDLSRFTMELLTHMRNLLVSLSAAGSLDVSEENRRAYTEQAAKTKPEVWIDYIGALSELSSRMKYAANERMLLEVCCIRLCSAAGQVAAGQGDGGQSSGQAQAVDGALLERLAKVEKAVKQGAAAQSAASSAGSGAGAAPKAEAAAKPAVFAKKAMPEDVKKVRSGWNAFVAAFPAPDKSFLAETKAGYLDTAQLFIVCGTMGIVSILKRKADLISSKLQETFGAEFDLQFVTSSEYEASHKRLFGEQDSFSEDGAIEDLKQSIHMDIEVE